MKVQNFAEPALAIEGWKAFAIKNGFKITEEIKNPPQARNSGRPPGSTRLKTFLEKQVDANKP